ncbi:MAG: phosphoenolpyruvate--protein phosphotransferase, partial [Candidatus Hydrogenedentes bacterium]|nr:phosphoenolpyruvate--protein phosphotransferase [Candidatus Hydrogenedentota bacterium]
MEIRLRGIGVSPGIAIGPALNFGAKSLDVPRYKIEDVDAELARFELAVQGVRRELEGLYERTKAAVGEHHARIFQTHLMFLEDPMLHDDIQQRLRDEGYNIEFALNDLIARYAKLLKEVDDPMIRERQQDVLDVGTRLLNILLNAEVENLTSLDRPSIIVARDLSPSETATLDMDNTLGLVTDVSGPTSHTAILARAFGLPSVVGLKYVSQHVAQGDTIIVDGSDGLVVIRPNAVTLDDFQGRQLKFEEERRHLLFQEQESRNITLDDVEIPAMANIELPIELSASQKARAQGIGLYRSEYLFLNRPVLPTEDEQFEAYSAVASAMMPHPVILRTLDLGGDKFASHLSMADELNPQLGWRAIRFCLERPDIFKCQLRAMFRASVHGNVQIMFPLISGLDELLRVKEVVNEVTVDLEARRVSFDCGIKFGAM